MKCHAFVGFQALRLRVFVVQLRNSGSTLNYPKRLVLRRGGHFPPHRQTSQKGLDLLLAVRQVFPAAHLVEMHLALNPIDVRALGMDRVMVEPQDVADLVE